MNDSVEETKETIAGSEQSEDLSRTVKVEKLIHKYVLGSAGIGLIPIPVVDFAGLVALQVKMLKNLTDIYEVEFKDDRATYIISTLVGSVVPTGVAGGAARTVAAVPVVGPLLGVASMPLLYGASTYALGRVMVQNLESGGTFLTFDPDKVKDFFREQFESGKQLIKKLGKSQEEAPKATTA